MARIAIVSEFINEQVLEFARSLRSQHHDIFLVTGVDQRIDDSSNFQILQFFRTWSAAEAAKFFFKVLPMNPEIWHFVYPDHENMNPKLAHIVLANLVRVFPRKVVATTFYDCVPETMATKMFVKSCDIITTATREDLMTLKRNLWPSKFCELEVLPPLETYMATTKNPYQKFELEAEDLSILVKNATPYIFVPSTKPAYIEWQEVEDVHKMIFNCRRRRKSAVNFYFTGGNLDAAQFEFLIKNSSAVLIAFQSIPMSDLLMLQRLCAKHQIPIIANSRQAEALPGICIPKRNGFIVRNKLQFQMLVSTNAKFELASPLFEVIKSEVLDTSMNELNRLYNKVRSKKELGVGQQKWQN